MCCKVVLITGASSSIGKACAELRTAEGHIVYGTSRRPSVTPTKCRMLGMDVTRDDSVQRAVATVLTEVGNIDAVVNNAGYALAGSIERTPPSRRRSSNSTPTSWAPCASARPCSRPCVHWPRDSSLTSASKPP
ncbi:SDR family NAD(P)-dependent oxidoreductase [Stigmatella erecta]|uniref:SDR family NAD(P)-dependent oxidoreductase n=1 Tax=Stigmatella erecta TaxID=83460 RepID=UPI001FE57822|nr:SDR family NAD(P)-dependent oxidoreductase [Stigmatella erecta]